MFDTRKRNAKIITGKEEHDYKYYGAVQSNIHKYCALANNIRIHVKPIIALL